MSYLLQYTSSISFYLFINEIVKQALSLTFAGRVYTRADFSNISVYFNCLEFCHTADSEPPPPEFSLRAPTQTPWICISMHLWSQVMVLLMWLGSHTRNHIFKGSGPVLTDDTQQREQQITYPSKSTSKMPSCSAHLLISAQAGRETIRTNEGCREEERIKRNTAGPQAS